MKQLITFATLCVLLTFIGCSDDDGVSYPASDNPEILVERDELYSNPNRNFIIKADLKDDLGLKSLRIVVPEFYLDKEITFPTDSLVTEYELAYRFLAPAETKEEETYPVNLYLTDVSGNTVSKTLTLYLDGDFNAPTFGSVTPSDGTVLLLEEEIQLNVSFSVTDDTGLDSVKVSIPGLDVDEQIKLNGEKEYAFTKTYTIPSVPEEYELTIEAVDNFIEPNRTTQNIAFSVSSEMIVLYLADVSKDTDLTADVFGVPQYYQRKQNGVFTFKYYADTDNKEIYFLGQESSFEPHCFGVSSEAGMVENSSTAAPIILPEKGYYQIEVNTKEMTYEVSPYTPVSTVWDPSNITICGNGIDGAGWDPNNTDFLMTANEDNPYILERDMTLTGADVAITITSPNWGDPFWRLDANASVIYLGGSNFTYPNEKSGDFKFIMDTETQRAKLVKQ